MIQQYDYLFKLVIVGSSSVGKSALIKRFVDDEFTESYLSTIGVDFRFKTLNVDNNIIKLQMWDTAGQCRFRTITSAYYKGAEGVLLVYDLMNQTSFQDIKDYWYGEVEKYTDKSLIKIVLIGNKSDLQSEKVALGMVQQFAKQKNIPHYEVSAKKGQGVSQAIMEMTRQLIKTHPKVERLQKRNSIIEQLRQKQKAIQLKSGNETGLQVKEKRCC